MLWLNSPAYLLLITGSLLGLTFPLGKLSAQAGVAPVIWAFVMSAGASIGLLIYRLLSQKPLLVNFRNLQFYCIAAIVSLVLPNILTFSVIPKLGSGFTGLLFTLSPLITLAISSVWQVRMPNRTGLIGIGLGFIGAIIVSVTRGEVGSPASFGWLLAGLCIPTSLAVGNVYRTMQWPKNAEPMELAIGMNLAAALMLLTLIFFMPSIQLPGGLEKIGITVLITILVASIMIALHSRLQFFGGPTYLSQIGFVAAVIALIIGTLLLDEHYSPLTWFGALIIILGATISSMSMKASASTKQS